MLNFIDNKSDFREVKSNLFEIFNEKLEIENNPFNNNFKTFIAFEFDFIWNKLFFESLQIFLKRINIESSFFYTINPSPEQYFYKHFNKFNIIQISVNNTNEELNEIMLKNPGDSPADAIEINSDDIAWFSNSKDWAIIGSRDLEIAIVGFTNKEVKNLFLTTFNENSNMFFTVKEQVDSNIELIKVDVNLKKIFDSIKLNYTDKI